jgi:hypothetical protein
MQKHDAIKSVESTLNKNFDSTSTGGLVVLDELTIERPYGWVFFVNTRRYAETKDRRFGVLGNGPVIFRKADQSIHKLPSGVHPDEAIAEFERKEKCEKQ